MLWIFWVFFFFTMLPSRHTAFIKHSPSLVIKPLIPDEYPPLSVERDRQPELILAYAMDVKRSSWGGGGMEGGRGTLKQMQRNVRGCQWDWWWRAHGCGELARPRPWLWLTSSPRGLLVDVTQRALWHFSASTSLWAAATLEPFPHRRLCASLHPPSIYLSILLFYLTLSTFSSL